MDVNFCKAFDKDHHKRLMRKVDALVIQGNVATWIEKWLAGRRQRVIVNGVTSDWTAFHCGAPKGLVLGPSLLSSISMTWTSSSPSRRLRLLTIPKLGFDAAGQQSVRVL